MSPSIIYIATIGADPYGSSTAARLGDTKF